MFANRKLYLLLLVALLVIVGSVLGNAAASAASAQRSLPRPTPSTPAASVGGAQRPTTAPLPTRQPTRTRSGGTLPQVTLQASFPAPELPAPSNEAAQAITTFNADQLGAAIDLVYAGTATSAVQATLQYLPAEIQAMMLDTTTISGASYWGLLQNGAAMVAVGDCSGDPAACAVSADSLSVELSSASSGTYGLLTQGTVATAQDALRLITTTYPKLGGLQFTAISDTEAGFAFSATTATLGLDPVTHQPISSATVVYAGVVSVSSQSFVYALVAVGEGYVSLMGS